MCPAAADGEEEAGPGVSGRTGEAGGESDGGGTDQPRKRKAVRFEQYDDKAFEDLMRMQEVRAVIERELRVDGLCVESQSLPTVTCVCGVCALEFIVLVHSCAPDHVGWDGARSQHCTVGAKSCGGMTWCVVDTGVALRFQQAQYRRKARGQSKWFPRNAADTSCVLCAACCVPSLGFTHAGCVSLQDHLKNQGNKPTTSTGRRGRPPVPRPKEPEQQGEGAQGAEQM